MLDQQKTDVYVSGYEKILRDFPHFQQSKSEARKTAAKIKGVFETIRKYQSCSDLQRDAGVESVCRVFETINSTGTRLTTFDLAVARFYPDPDLRGLWQQTLIDHPVLKEFEVDGEHRYKSCHFGMQTSEDIL